ncbi:MAG: UvrD-helicase domain-containing protein [Nitrospiraceae bacterium]|nr:UvrD-helicase domain-containing protein [Nitrospiraceae bacterium]
MIDWNDFENAVVSQLRRDISRQGNPEQNIAISSPPNQSLFIVAGPGSGKTTVIVLKVLKLIFVDDINPSNILVTTFTRKAASELRSRILGWGDQLRQAFINNPSYNPVDNQLKRLDFNRIITGTLDSISEEVLGDNRAPGTPPPVVIEDFVSNALMIRVGLFSHGRHNNQDLKDFIADLKGTKWGLNVSEISATLREIRDRFHHDQIDIDQFRDNPDHPGVPIACDAIDDYTQELQNRLLFDFAGLEQEFLTQLRAGTLDKFLQEIRFVLVDEYQDTNLLQERIYFELARAAVRNGGSITVVGDDDQSLYRFRGATVDLFQAFLDRVNNQLGISPQRIYLSRNYRSTPIIVDFCNKFVVLDYQFQIARVQDKPPIITARSHPFTNYPVLGMFRDDVESLANDLAQFIHRIVYGEGVRIQDHQGDQHTIEINPRGGSPADIALLCSSPRELDSQGRPRLTLLLRHELNQLHPAISIFNPRGQNLERIPDVQKLCGLILECIDPDSSVQNNILNLPQDAVGIFDMWRDEANTFVNHNPPPTTPRSLGQFVNAWQYRTPLGRRRWDSREIALADLVYKLITWIPNMQSDIEGLVHLEAITRTITQAELFSNFGAQIIFDENNPNLEQASIKEALWNIFVPIATGVIGVDEDLLETLPNDRINVMSIHQAKGLEFPLVIVDVGSDFRKNHWKQAFKRFPRLDKNGRVDTLKSVNMEDELRRYSPLGQPTMSALNRAFDDLIRHYFVGYSRPQDILLLVGLNSVINGIPNIATGWDRDQNWHWQRGLNNIVHI